jgi:hypothetical protein
MTNMTSRLETVEQEIEFRFWIRFQRMLEAFSEEELKRYASTGKWPDRDEPMPGESRFDQLDRKSLQSLWKEHEKQHEGRNREQLRFYGLHGHWPEEGCGTNCVKSECRSGADLRDSNPDMLIQSPFTGSENKENPATDLADSGKVLQNPQPPRNRSDPE